MIRVRHVFTTAAFLCVVLLLAACDATVSQGSPHDMRTSKRKSSEHAQNTDRTQSAVRSQPRQQRAAPVTMAERSGGTAQDRTLTVMPSVQPIRRPRPRLPVRMEREQYAELDGNPVRRVAEHPVSTFSIDVDTGSYTNVRRMLNAGQLPPKNAVRVEEFINYFDYHYPVPDDAEQPFSMTTALAPTPWNADTKLLRIGIQGWLPPGDPPPANLVFLIDVSGSMHGPQRLPLLKSALKLLVRQLDGDDRVSIVTYAGQSDLALEPTPGDETAKILAVIDGLQAAGSTNGGDGIRRAYDMARQAYIDDGINRVILATDGDFNVGTVDFDTLTELVARRAEAGIALTTLGFGVGNYNEKLMEQLAGRGDGNYAYIDSLSEAERVLVANRAATLHTIAKDVKIQVEFNPAVVAEYRLIGYENRMLDRAEFNNDKVDAGDIGAGRNVTALYEIALVGSGGSHMDPLRYQATDAEQGKTDEAAFLRLRYKLPDEHDSRLIETPIAAAAMQSDPGDADDSLRFAAAVAAFGQLLRGGTWTGDYDYDDVLALARTARGQDSDGRRGEFLQLVKLAAALDTRE